jgi:hypothetical protein
LGAGAEFIFSGCRASTRADADDHTEQNGNMDEPAHHARIDKRPLGVGFRHGYGCGAKYPPLVVTTREFVRGRISTWRHAPSCFEFVDV